MRTPTLLLSALLSLAVAAAHADEVDTLCADSPTETLDHHTQKQQYCQAAKSANTAAQSNGMLWKVYAAAATVCTAACAASMTPLAATGGMGTWACSGAAIGAGGYDAITTKNYMGAMGSIIAGGGSLAFSKLGGQSALLGPASGEGSSFLSRTDLGSCASAATTGMTAITKNQAEKDAEKTLAQNEASIKALASTVPVGTPAGPPANVNVGVIPGMGGETAPLNAGTNDGLLQDTTAKAFSGCSGGSQDASKVLQCAASADTGLGTLLSNPKFGSDFQKASGGQSLGDFLKGGAGDSPASAIPASLGGTLTGDGQNKLAGLLASMGPQPSDAVAGGATYSGGGGRGGASGGDDIGKSISGMLGQFFPGKKDEAGAAGSRGMQFGLNGRKPASNATAEDRDISLFDRVTSRYSDVLPRLSVMADPENTKFKDFKSATN